MSKIEFKEWDITMDLHTHTRHSDGNDTAEEMILSAIDKGMKIYGISDHSPLPREPWCMDGPTVDKQYEEVKLLKDKYKDKITIITGVEQDYYSSAPEKDYDYILGSVHGTKRGDHFIFADYSPERIREDIHQYYDDDFYAYAEEYYELLSQVVDKTHCDVVGHFDLLSKFNEHGELFDENHPRYIAAWKKAADAILKKDVFIEVNTGAISRGWRTTPYPAKPIFDYLKAGGAKFVFGSDTHSVETIGYEFDKWSKALSS